MKTLVIEREAVKNNIGVIKERAGEAVIYAVLTGDGQGAGLVELARLRREEPKDFQFPQYRDIKEDLYLVT